MSDTLTALFPSIVGPCPTCHNGILQPVSDGDATNLLCTACGACWHPELGWIRRVNPDTCPGCAFRGTCKPVRRTGSGDEA